MLPPTNVSPCVTLEGEDYGLKVSINGPMSPVAANHLLKSQKTILYGCYYQTFLSISEPNVPCQGLPLASLS